MSNILYEDKMYNGEVKELFISEYGLGTQKILNRIFKISQASENDLGKDLFEFNREELRLLFFLYRAKTEYSSKANVSWVQKYIDWAIEEGYYDGMNPLDTVDTKWKEQFVNKSIKKYWTDREVEKIIDSLVNYQDRVVVILPFNGVRGVGNCEIINLQVHDVDAFNEKLSLRDSDGKVARTIPVSEKCIKLCEAALKEDVYEKKNGNASPDIKAPNASLVDNNYVVKSAITRTDHHDEAEKNVVHRRLTNISKSIDEPQFTPLNIIYSGMLAMAKDLYLKNGKLEDEEYRKICEQFNVSVEQSLYRLKSEFLNIETIKSLYPHI
ncbi:integrase [Paenibacillus sp. N1-5-1-14]|uniref:phage lytic cycle repressor MrpR family protein n=1 Tax=Paenibacillus radicibacter TaxID=2972488 RepID=UPI002158EFDF|nr:integrase [Paenibacillus radicibacter]MCR8641457.1 integrase [Paenibacillus radicibacter]